MHGASGGREIIDESVAKKRQQQAQGAGGANGPGAQAAGFTGQLPAIQLQTAHPAVIAIAALGDDK